MKIYRITSVPGAASGWDKNMILSYAARLCRYTEAHRIPIYATTSLATLKTWHFIHPDGDIWEIDVDPAYVRVSLQGFDPDDDVCTVQEFISTHGADDLMHTHEVVAAVPTSGWVRVRDGHVHDPAANFRAALARMSAVFPRA